jgi:hypothetical protein
MTAPAASSYVVGQLSPAPLALPLVMNDVDGLRTSIQIQNPNRTAVGVTLVFYDPQGNPAHQIEQTLQPGGAHTYDLSGFSELSPGFVGSATLQSQDGQPLHAIVSVLSN